MRKLILLFLITLIPGISLRAVAQKRPQVQDTSIWMGAFVADGRLDEWTGSLQAVNDDSSIEYSLANDDLYLYLVVRSNHTSKIFLGGVSLSVERPEKPDAMVLFPYNPAYDWSKGVMEAMSDPRSLRTIADAELIETSGITGGRDSILFIANEYGIQAAMREMKVNTEMYPDGELHYVVEMAIPLQHLDLDLSDPDGRDLNYRIGLRGVKIGSSMGRGGMMMFGMGSAVMIGGNFGDGGPSRRQQEYEQIKSRDMSVSTGLKGVYRLSRNPQ